MGDEWERGGGVTGRYWTEVSRRVRVAATCPRVRSTRKVNGTTAMCDASPRHHVARSAFIRPCPNLI
eukprot:scaffold589_cov118-Isochrysis_galbana.AAC.5